MVFILWLKDHNVIVYAEATYQFIMINESLNQYYYFKCVCISKVMISYI